MVSVGRMISAGKFPRSPLNTIVFGFSPTLPLSHSLTLRVNLQSISLPGARTYERTELLESLAAEREEREEQEERAEAEEEGAFLLLRSVVTAAFPLPAVAFPLFLRHGAHH